MISSSCTFYNERTSIETNHYYFVSLSFFRNPLAIDNILLNEILYLSDVTMESSSTNFDEAKEKWLKFKQVDELLRSVNEYMDIYRQMKESGQLKHVVGTSGENEAMHEIPAPYDESTWNEFTEDEKLKKLMEQAKQTQGALVSLTEEINKGFNVKCSEGPVKEEERIKEKRDKDYKGEVRRVIDIIRCSFVLSDGLESAKKLVSEFQSEDNAGIFRDWEMVRIKDGFEKAENFIVGGYRDLKLNLRWKPTGHIVEVQLHLSPYYELKENGGHKHYTFARSLDLKGVTDAAVILTADGGTFDRDDHAHNLKWGVVIQVAEAELEETAGRGDTGDDFLLEKARVLRRVGELYSIPLRFESQQFGVGRLENTNKAIKCFEEARQVLEGLQDCLSGETSIRSRDIDLEQSLLLNKLSDVLVTKHLVFDPEHNVDSRYDPYPFEQSMKERFREQFYDHGDMLENKDDVLSALYPVFEILEPNGENQGAFLVEDFTIDFMDDAVNTSVKTVGTRHPFTLSVKHTQWKHRYSILYQFRNRLRKAHEMLQNAAEGEENFTRAMEEASDEFLADIDARYKLHTEELFEGYREVIQDQTEILGRGHPDLLKTQKGCFQALWNRPALKEKNERTHILEAFSLLLDAAVDATERLGVEHSLSKELHFMLNANMMQIMFSTRGEPSSFLDEIQKRMEKAYARMREVLPRKQGVEGFGDSDRGNLDFDY